VNRTLKAVIIELTGGNVRNHHINLKGAFGMFPDDAIGGRNKVEAGKSVRLCFGHETVESDIDGTKAIFRERGAIKRFFERDSLAEGDLVLIERIDKRAYSVTKASKRGFKYYL
jgi:hypothetical protein